MSNNGINAKDKTTVGCTNASDITAETIGDKRYLHTIDKQANNLQQQSNNKLDEMITCLTQLKDNKTTKVADEIISAIKLVSGTSPTNVKLGQPDTTKLDATIIGLSVTAASTGNQLEIITFGEVTDSSFTYTYNEPLFLGVDGNITNIVPTTGMLTKIGYGLGAGKIFIDIQETIIL